jgi:hypothetical protein
MALSDSAIADQGCTSEVFVIAWIYEILKVVTACVSGALLNAR